MLMSALETLPEKERAALVMRDLEGLTTEEVARVLRSRPVTVRSQISSARTKLKIHCERLLRRGGRHA
jgi:RNA polymerase sigma-70 factor (ECF subfamily)